MISSWIVVLGSSADLAEHELRSLYPSSSMKKLSGSCVLLEQANVDPQKIRETAGGVVKIAKKLDISHVDPESLAEFLVSGQPEKKEITYGVSRYDGGEVTTSFLYEIKKRIEEKGFRARFVTPKENELTSVVIQKQQVHDIVICKDDQGLIFGLTVAVQDFESWGARDYGRPFANPKSGMLPPKVARMAVNIAVGNVSGMTVLDPFCGMGTVLAEALMRGCHVIGSDQSTDVVEKAKKNLEWLGKEPFELYVSDATHISEKLPAGSIDAIVTEPFMGSSAIGERRITDPDKISDIVRGLEKLYIGALKDWMGVLKPEGKIVIALPEFTIGDGTYFVKKVVDNCENLGYSIVEGPIEYSRPQAIVKRKFYIFKKNGTR